MKMKAWLIAHRPAFVAVTTEWIIGETCTLLVARRVPHLIDRFSINSLRVRLCGRSIRYGSVRPDKIVSTEARESWLFVCGLSEFLRNEKPPNLGSAHHGTRIFAKPALALCSRQPESVIADNLLRTGIVSHEAVCLTPVSSQRHHARPLSIRQTPLLSTARYLLRGNTLEKLHSQAHKRSHRCAS